ncbi:hypothetical protein E4U19_000407 [Claviceps sp. Clav32 group G5]|nr:hypothetical protein E4U19_000407 [Claviceps sp. Clav32 group G5]
MTTPATDSMYVLQDIPGKGKGLVATQNIPKGTRILCEEPLFTIPIVPDFQRERFRLICLQVALLSGDQRDAFLSMHNIYPPRDPVEEYSQTTQTRGIYLEACRLNHDCQNNAVYSWNTIIKRITVHAIRDINAGEEITVPYVEFLKTRESRQTSLKDSFQFTCVNATGKSPNCPLRRTPHLEDGEFPAPTLGYVDAQTRLFNELYKEGCGYPFSYHYAVMIAMAHGDLARARIFAQRALSSIVTRQGSDSEEAIKYADMIKNPENCSKSCANSKKWETSVDDPAPLAPAQLTNLSGQSRFCGFVVHGFDDLPMYRNGTDAAGSLELLDSCFLGEVVEILVPHPLDLKVRDINGKTVELHFYTKNECTELKPSQYERGHTIAILNASQYVFKYGPRGIRHTDPTTIKVNTIAEHGLFCINLPTYP